MCIRDSKLLRIIPDISHAKVKGLFRLRRLQEIRMELRQYGFLPAGIRGFPQSGRCLLYTSRCV